MECKTALVRRLGIAGRDVNTGMQGILGLEISFFCLLHYCNQIQRISEALSATSESRKKENSDPGKFRSCIDVTVLLSPVSYESVFLYSAGSENCIFKMIKDKEGKSVWNVFGCFYLRNT